jgi:lipoyl(octanoyl) transferase
MICEQMRLWVDPVRRSGPEAMAVDEWLLETVETPVLRVYRWAGEWASVGYFGEISVARRLFPGVDLVRRWTGGGMVDHRSDWTYTLAVPRGEPLAELRGAESYRQIHAALAETLRAEGISARVSGGGEETGAVLCFENPVSYDLVGDDGGKLAGAGQRRSSQGLLHQGSVAGNGGDWEISKQRAEHLASRLAGRWLEFPAPAELPESCLQKLGRYQSEGWTCRR